VKVPYSTLRPTLKTGDILAFSGTSPLDWMIRFEEGQPYTHVGMVLQDGGKLWFWDAPGGGTTFPDPYYPGGGAHDGARVADLDTLLAYYMTVEVALYARQLAAPVSAAQQSSLLTFISVANGSPFPGASFKLPDELNLGAGLALSALLGIKFHATIAGYYFCAHLVADSLMHMGMMAIAPFPANAYSPADLSTGGKKTVPMKGSSFSPVVQVSYP